MICEKKKKKKVAHIKNIILKLSIKNLVSSETTQSLLDFKASLIGQGQNVLKN